MGRQARSYCDLSASYGTTRNRISPWLQSCLQAVDSRGRRGAKNRDFGFLPWAAWPNRTNNYLSNNLAALWLGEMSAKEYMEGTQKVFEEDFEQGLVVVSPEPRK